VNRFDHHYAIGSGHSVCQDYASSCKDFAALSDGCSRVYNAAGKLFEAHTDIGARLLVRAAMRHSHLAEMQLLARLVVATADEARRLLTLPRETLSATLGWVRQQCCGYIDACLSGDGVIAGRTKIKEWHVYAIYSETDGKPMPPYYPCYIDAVSRDQYLATTRVLRIGENAPPLYCYSGDGLCNFRQVAFNSDYDLVVVMSDGAFSFTKDRQPITLDIDFVGKLLDFRNMTGRFVERNFRGVLGEFARDGITHYDDISMIACYRDSKEIMTCADDGDSSR